MAWPAECRDIADDAAQERENVPLYFSVLLKVSDVHLTAHADN